jgi:trigger factor
VQVTINELSAIKQEADIQLSMDELQPHFVRAYEEFRPKVELKGFRKGKVPMPMIRQLYGDAVEKDALDTIADEFYRKAMDEKQIHPVGRPTMVDMDFRRGESFRFKITYEIKPAITLGKYKGVAADKPVHAVTDAEVEAEILSLRRAHSTRHPAESVTDQEHMVTGDVQELDDSGAPLIGKKTAGATFSLFDETLAPEIRAALMHATVGATVRTRFESKHGDHTHPVHIAITPTAIEKVDLPAFDDALVSTITGGKVTSAEAFTASLRTDLARYWDDQSTAKLNDNIARAVVDAHDFPVPDALVDSILDSFVEDLKVRSRDRKLRRGFDETKFREESRSYATWQAKWMLLKEKIAEAESLAVSDAEIDAMAESEAASTGIAKDRLLAFYRSSSASTERLLSEKVMALLRSKAKITEKPAADEPR